ncbi:MAG: MATE family efflux transporter [Bacteroidales bacterium]
MNRKILKLAGPSILANITVPLVGMVDLAIAGRLEDAACIGAMAIGTMLFDLLYWNMGFLRAGTGGYTAQAYGRRDFPDAMKVLVQAVGTALFAALFIWAIQYIFVEAAFLIIDCSPKVEKLAKVYFYIRIWAAPATLAQFAFKGWFIGMQNTISPMILDVTVNVINLLLCLLFALHWGMGIPGIALGTLVAQYIGLAMALLLMFLYYRKLFKYINLRASLKLREMKNFFTLNGNLFIRSLCFLGVYSGFTALAAKYGDNLLAVSTIMMKLMLLYSYFIDGFAYAGEALTGKFIGARDVSSLKKTIKWIFVWCIAIGLVSTLAYLFAGEPLFRLMTNNETVVTAAREFLPWLLVMPLMSCIAFTWDGIFLGATASAAIRNTMIISVISFFACYYIFEGKFGIQALWIGYAVHLVVRSVIMTIVAKREVINRAFVN